jgi:hypothetical protein
MRLARVDAKQPSQRMVRDEGRQIDVRCVPANAPASIRESAELRSKATLEMERQSEKQFAEITLTEHGMQIDKSGA